ncbi:MAG: phosphorybosylanthranilate isomerase, partial [Planctomycetes bacterium]|nr:phosphorybosylanthranilate isomerase [Planctomycetota bacterium]
AFRLLRERHRAGPQVAILADLEVKFGTPLYRPSLETLARSTAERGLADALIVTGEATGAAVDRGDLDRVRGALPGLLLLAGSGVRADNVAEVLGSCDGAIVGSDLKVGGYVENPVCPERLRRFVDAFRAAR